MKTSKGFTLLEVIIAITITVMIIGIAGNILISTTYGITNSQIKADAHNIAVETMDYIEEHIKLGKSVVISSTQTKSSLEENETLIYLDEIKGLSIKNGADKERILSNSFFYPYTPVLVFEQEHPEKPLVEIELKLEKNNQEEYSLKRVVELQNSLYISENSGSGQWTKEIDVEVEDHQNNKKDKIEYEVKQSITFDYQTMVEELIKEDHLKPNEVNHNDLEDTVVECLRNIDGFKWSKYEYDKHDGEADFEFKDPNSDEDIENIGDIAVEVEIEIEDGEVEIDIELGYVDNNMLKIEQLMGAEALKEFEKDDDDEYEYKRTYTGINSDLDPIFLAIRGFIIVEYENRNPKIIKAESETKGNQILVIYPEDK